MTALTAATADRTRLLRLALGLDAAVTGANGLAYLVAAGPLADLLGPDPALLRAIGAFLLVYGIAVGLLARRPAAPVNAVRAVIVVNVAWALESVAVVALGLVSFTTLGAVWAVLQAVVVAAFAALQLTALRRPA
ncbi:hypothetical protein Sru01_01540 [Sphaerisporangium rufum]|uniref:Integral membrane protein n=1 Tax=Sphaerisporangium rufum TaxID=1381558 RepID=A0A919R1F0_9ACTN|nr:hypothetical protein [Sphaerisporangium rufum]GII75172.1 hypothetical protein Sru01_01540 [Sphaerisporangium rufum]